jgi:hypothetical protein
MAWDNPGVTIRRFLDEQSVNVANWGANPLRIPFAALQQTGYLEKLELYSPYTDYAASVTGSNLTANAASQWGPQRPIQRLQLNTQGASSLYDVTGIGLAVLNYMRNGTQRRFAPTPTQIIGITGAGSATYPEASFSGLSDSKYFSPYTYQTSADAKFGYYCDIPITEQVRVRAITPSGSKVSVPSDMWVELGMLTLQNMQQNVQPNITLNPAYNTDYSSPWRTTDTSTVILPSVPWVLNTTKYDVPADPADYPPSYMQQYIVTRTEISQIPISAGGFTYAHAAAGLLLRVGYWFSLQGTTTNANQYVDIGAENTGASLGATLQFIVGNTTYLWQDRVYKNLARSAREYGQVPNGFLCLDFMADGSDIQAPNTAVLSFPRSVMSGLDTGASGPTHVNIVEERLIPVVAG